MVCHGRTPSNKKKLQLKRVKRNTSSPRVIGYGGTTLLNWVLEFVLDPNELKGKSRGSSKLSKSSSHHANFKYHVKSIGKHKKDIGNHYKDFDGYLHGTARFNKPQLVGKIVIIYGIRHRIISKY